MGVCNKCRFAIPHEGQLYCHFNPPTGMASGNQVLFLHPVVQKDQWCGQFKLALERLFRGHVGT